MKLIISSFLTDNLSELFPETIGKPLSESKCVLIANAVDLKSEERHQSIDGFINSTFRGFQEVRRLDLRTFVGKDNDLNKAIGDADLLWIIGGDLFYLNYLVVKSGLKDVLVKKAQGNGNFVCGGDSAGAIVFGLTLEGFDLADDISKAPEAFYDGMGFMNFVVVPHANSEKYGSIVFKIKEILQEKGFKVVAINDNQSIVVDKGELKIDTGKIK